MTFTSWTDQRIGVLRQLWTDGLSAREIALRLGGVTRNAVLGKLHRLGLLGSRPKSTARPPRVKPPATLRRRRDPPARAQIAEVARSPLPEGPGLVAGVRELRPRCCRWPIGDPRSPDFTFCGRQTGSGPYCPAHRRLAYRPAGAAGAADAA